MPDELRKGAGAATGGRVHESRDWCAPHLIINRVLNTSLQCPTIKVYNPLRIEPPLVIKFYGFAGIVLFKTLKCSFCFFTIVKLVKLQKRLAMNFLKDFIDAVTVVVNAQLVPNENKTRMLRDEV